MGLASTCLILGNKHTNNLKGQVQSAHAVKYCLLPCNIVDKRAGDLKYESASAFQASVHPYGFGKGKTG